MPRTQDDEQPNWSAEHLSRRVLEVCDAAGAFIEYWGFKAIHGRVWTLLALRREAMSQVEIAETLGVSRSLISGAMAELAEFGLVRPTHDHRNAPWVAVMDVWATISDVLRTREWMLLERARSAIEAAIEEAELAGSDGPWDVHRLRSLQAMTELAQALLKMLISIRVPTSIDGLGDWLLRARQLVVAIRGR